MYVCICHAVTERQIREAAQCGFRSVKALKESLGVASKCAKCARYAQCILRECAVCEQPGDDGMQPS